jgi:type IV fimbrial biogenesis protein FimT
LGLGCVLRVVNAPFFLPQLQVLQRADCSGGAGIDMTRGASAPSIRPPEHSRWSQSDHFCRASVVGYVCPVTGEKSMHMRFRQKGVTLIELMVTIAVLAVLATLAAPSFADFRERQALRGVADNFVAAIGLAKEEAVKRDSYVRVDFKPFGTNGVCMGAVTVSSGSATSGCDCASNAASCTVALFPENVNDLQKVQVVGSVTLNDVDINYGAGNGFVIDPKTATLYDINSGGKLTLFTSRGYRAAVQVNAMARPTVCTPTDAVKSLPGIQTCN